MSGKFNDLVIAECEGFIRVRVTETNGERVKVIEILDVKGGNVRKVSDRRIAQYELPKGVEPEPIVRDGEWIDGGTVIARIPSTSASGHVGMRTLLDAYGNVAALFHPDYLPHLSHTYLKLSQTRALNMPPRRIQLLGRQWTSRGLESEYVVVHDVSEMRSEYSEHPERVTADQQTEEKPSSNEDDKKEERKTKWRSRPLKKRARVVVAPDGSLLKIAIEEERQFNI